MFLCIDSLHSLASNDQLNTPQPSETETVFLISITSDLMYVKKLTIPPQLPMTSLRLQLTEPSQTYTALRLSHFLSHVTWCNQKHLVSKTVLMGILSHHPSGDSLLIQGFTLPLALALCSSCSMSCENKPLLWLIRLTQGQESCCTSFFWTAIFRIIHISLALY